MRLIFANRLEKRRKYGYFILQWSGPGGGMADAADLKSAFRNEVRVRSPSRVPFLRPETPFEVPLSTTRKFLIPLFSAFSGFGRYRQLPAHFLQLFFATETFNKEVLLWLRNRYA